MFNRKLSLESSQVVFKKLTEINYNFFCIIKIPIHGIDSKGLGFVFFYFLVSSFSSLFFLETSSLKVLSFSFSSFSLKIFLESPLLSFYFTTTF